MPRGWEDPGTQNPSPEPSGRSFPPPQIEIRGFSELRRTKVTKIHHHRRVPPVPQTLTQVLSDLQHQPRLPALHLQRVQDGRQPLVELHVNHGPDNGHDAAGTGAGLGGGGGLGRIVPAWGGRDESRSGGNGAGMGGRAGTPGMRPDPRDVRGLPGWGGNGGSSGAPRDVPGPPGMYSDPATPPNPLHPHPAQSRSVASSVPPGSPPPLPSRPLPAPRPPPAAQAPR